MGSRMDSHRARQVVVTVSLLFAGFLCLPLEAQILRIYHIDVEEGDATLIVAPSGKTMLVDSGRDGDGERIQAVMENAGVERLDFFVNTHYHGDHYGGIDELVDAGVEIRKAFDRGDKDYIPAEKKAQPAYQEYLNSIGFRAEPLIRGMMIPLDPTMKVTCIASGGIVMGEVDPSPGLHEDDMSVSLLIELGAFRYFLGGDIEFRTESKIAAADLVLDVDVYRANAHGSDTSSSPAFLSDLSPTVVLISNGSRVGHQHPRAATLEAFHALAIPPTVFQTNKYVGPGEDAGNVADAFIADTDPLAKTGTILVTVDAPFGTYEVSFAPDVSHSFSIKERSGFDAVARVDDPVTAAELPAASGRIVEEEMEGLDGTEVIIEKASSDSIEAPVEPFSPLLWDHSGAEPATLEPESEAAVSGETTGAEMLAAEPSPPALDREWGQREEAKAGTEASSLVTYLAVFSSLFLAGLAGYSRLRKKPETGLDLANAQPTQPPFDGEVDPETGDVGDPEPLSLREDKSEPVFFPSRARASWQRFSDSDIPEELQGGSRYTWVRIQPGRLTSRQGYLSVELSQETDFLTNVPVGIDSEICQCIEEWRATDDEDDPGTIDLYNQGSALHAALANCCDSDRAFLLMQETDRWLNDLKTAIATRFSEATAALLLEAGGEHLKQRAEKVLEGLLKLLQGFPRFRNTQSTPIRLKCGLSLPPAGEAFQNSFGRVELQRLLHIGAVERCPIRPDLRHGSIGDRDSAAAAGV